MNSHIDFKVKNLDSLRRKEMPNPELRSLYEIFSFPPQKKLQEYFLGIITILSEYFPVTYSALFIQDSEKEDLRLEALFGLKRELHPSSCSIQKGIIGEVLKSKKPGVIHDLNREPLYEEMIKTSKSTLSIHPPLLCTPLITGDEPFGLLILSPLYEFKEKLMENLRFLTVLSALLSPMIKKYYHKVEESKTKQTRATSKASLLEELLAERLNEVLNRIDPYVEARNRIGLMEEITGWIEKIMIQSALKKVDFVQTSAAQLLGINRNTLRAKMKKYKIKVP